MFKWLSNIFMTSTADLAFEAAIYSANTASCNGVYQLSEPKNLQETAAEYRALSKKENNLKGYIYPFVGIVFPQNNP